MAVGIATTDVEGRFLEANAKFCEIVGRPGEALLGMRMQDLTHPDDLPTNLSLFERAATEGQPFFVEKRYLRPDGSTVWVRNHVSPIRDASGRIARAPHRRASPRHPARREHAGPGQPLRDSPSCVGMPWGSWTREADRAETEARLAAVLRGETRIDDVLMAVGDGTERWVRFVSQPEVDPETGRVVRIYGAGQDVTEHKQREAELVEAKEQAQRSEAAFRQLADAMPQIVWTTRPDGFHDYYNARWYDYTGMPTEGVQGWSWSDYLHPDDLARTKALWEHSLATGAPYEVEYRFRRASDGAYRWFMARAEPDRNALGEIERWFGTCTDVHDLREAREAVRASEERFRLIAQTTSDAVWDWDLATDVFWHGGGIDSLFGYEAGEREDISASWTDRIHPDDAARVQADLEAHIDRGTEQRYEYRFRRTDGTYANVVDRGMVIRNAEGVAVRMVGAMADVTADREYEAALVEAKELAEQAQAKAEEMSRLKDAFLANMSHEIRTPLTSILGFADLLSEVVDEEGRELVEYIQTGGKRLRDTLTSVLELSQLQAGHVVLTTTPLPLAPLVDETIRVLSSQARKCGVTLTSSVVPPYLKVLAERGALGRILVNLIGNAIKFTPDGGCVHVQARQEDGGVAIAISDTGVGISPAFLPHLFDDFRQESQGLGRSHEGSGLGLAISKRLVDLMGGTVAAESTKGVGTTFTVRVPGPEARAVLDEAPAAKIPATGPRVLLVEDHESTRSFAQWALQALHVDAAGARVLWQPRYSPDRNAVEQAWSKLKERVRRLRADTGEELAGALSEAVESITSRDVAGWMRQCGYTPQPV